MQILLLCAGARDKTWTGAETACPLRTKGKRQAQKIGCWLGQKGLRPDAVLSEPTTRARVTAEKALKAAGWTARGIEAPKDLSDGRLPSFSDKDRVLLVAAPNRIKALATSLALEIETRSGMLLMVEDRDGGALLRERVDPRDLPDLFPYPSPDGPGRRARPAYYYTQSAIIPFRRTEAGPEILIVGSSSGRHWVVPKGIVEPGLSPARSAMIEAREEAGVEGSTGDTPLGSFTYEKWGAPCNVAVYAMEVSRILPEDAWEENHRNRRWVTRNEAADLLNEPAFKALLPLI
ncbi:NUDIX domain-containing protein [Roseibium sp. MMSF_3412]|uniref:NUDIX hydrolase n=1 Tax=Roseibium sp. MMSF_3412 TaxID=3046712 RepID=UPI00273EC81D|nr:NUDIX domain-containing protein [Roseibium sp. MMSF_3412]